MRIGERRGDEPVPQDGARLRRELLCDAGLAGGPPHLLAGPPWELGRLDGGRRWLFCSRRCVETFLHATGSASTAVTSGSA